MASTIVRTLPALLVGLLIASPTRAHVAPSVDKNNRYMKIEPMGDRIRFAYTIFWGQVPGAQTRQQLDRNRNGTLESSEIDPYKREIATSVAASLEFVVDGRPQPMQWAQVHMGLNTPDVSAGAFSIDLVGWLCLASPRKRTNHEIRFYDRYKLPKPGETELTLKEAAGVTITRSTIGDHEGSLLKFRWQGGSSKLGSEGYLLQLKVNPAEADIGMDDLCVKQQARVGAAASKDDTATTNTNNKSSALPLWLWLLLGGGVVGGALILVGMRRR